MESKHYVARILDVLAGDVDRPAIRWQGTELSAAEILAAVRQVATALRELGVSTGVTVAILTDVNSPWMLVARYAVHLLGGTVVYISGANQGTTTHRLSMDTRTRMLRESGASVLMFDSGNGREAEQIRERVAEPVRLCGLGVPLSGPVTADGDVVTDVHTEFPPCMPERAMVLYTSGSTGQPKGVCKSFAAWNEVVLRQSAAASPMAFLAVSAVSHTGGLPADMAMASGGFVLLRRGFDPGSFLRDITHHRITDTLIGVPQFYELAGHPDAHTADLSSLRGLVYVGSPASPELVKAAVRVFPGVLIHSYGTTETGRITMLTPEDHDDPALLSTVGKPRPDVRMSIRDPETGKEVPAGQVGEVVVRSPDNMQCYVKDPGRTARVLRDGWVYTGDLGLLDADGYLRLFGRMNDVVKVHDTRVYPSEVEKVLVSHAGVIDAYVYAHRRSDLVEELHAAVVLRAGNLPSFHVLREHVGRTMTPTHAPAKFIRWREFPINDAGKVDRPLVRARGSHIDSEDAAFVMADR